MSKQVIVDKYPKCNFCKEDAHFDAKTTMGPWANMCGVHMHKYGIGLGTGLGQELIRRSDNEQVSSMRSTRTD